MKSIICGMALATLVSPALADEYWVEYNYSTHTCSIVEKKAQEPAAGAAHGTTVADTTNGGWHKNTSAPDAATMLNPTQGAEATNATTADRIRAWMAERSASGAPNATTTSVATRGAANTTTEGGASGAPNAATTSVATQGAGVAKTTREDLIRAWIAERNAYRAPNAASTSVATQGAANTTTEGGASGAPNAATTSVATQGAANTTTEGSASGAPNAAAAPDTTTPDTTQDADSASATTQGSASGAPNDAATTSDATQGADPANATTQGSASGAPNDATAWAVPTGGGNFDPFKNLAAAWERKKAAAEAAGTDTTKALIGTAMHSRKEAEDEMQVLRMCELDH